MISYLSEQLLFWGIGTKTPFLFCLIREYFLGFGISRVQLLQTQLSQVSLAEEI
jgi:hypothetical protein